jgi:hypothetical protein
MTDVSRMAAAPDTGVTVSERDAVSPELALVDPRLAASARVLLPDPDDTLAPAGQSTRTRRRLSPVSVLDHGFFSYENAEATSAEARQRLMDSGIDSEVMGSQVPAGRHVRRCTTLIPTSSAAASVVLFVLQLYVSRGALG